MKRLNLFLIFISLILVSCQSELIEKIESTHPNGIPMKVDYYKVIDGKEVLVKHIRYYESGEKQEEGGFLGTERNGEWTYWHPNGNKWSVGNFTNGLPNGKSTVWFENGDMRFTGFYSDGETDGEWTYWDIDGNKSKEVIFEKGEIIDEKSFD